MRVNKEKVKDYYTRGYNAKEIGKFLNLKADTVQRCINRNFSDLKFNHRKARALNKDIKRALDNTNNSYISNSSFLKQNRQAYSYNRNMNITFDEKSNGERTIDTPKTYYHK